MSEVPETVDFPALDAKIARIGFGCDPMGRHGWGQTDEDDLVRAVHGALERGVHLFDTADVYGLGVSEQILGKALRGKRQQAVIATKCGVRRAEGKTFHDNSEAWIRRAVEESLARLGTDYIDLYQLHYWDGKTPVQDTLGVFGELRRAGKIRAFGVTNVDLAAHAILRPREGLASFSFEYSLAKRDCETAIFRQVEQLGLAFLSWGSLGQGILSGKYHGDGDLPENDRRRRAVYVNFRGEKLRQNLRIVRYMRQIQPHYAGKTLPQLAIRWILDRVPRSIALVGIKRPAQLRDNVGSLGWKLAEEHFRDLCALSKRDRQAA